MIADTEVRLATLADAADIAAMSRAYIEVGLTSTWTETRIQRSIQNPDTNVVVVSEKRAIVGFGIMSYPGEEAHLLLFAVTPARQRQGIGSAILDWLEEVARAAGVRRIHVECRRDNVAARNFYAEHGYHEQTITKGYYRGTIDAIRFEKWLVPS